MTGACELPLNLVLSGLLRRPLESYFSCRLLERESAATNPALPECIASGTGSGVAMAAAAGLADVGIGMDHLIGPRVIPPFTICGEILLAQPLTGHGRDGTAVHHLHIAGYVGSM